MSIAKGHVQRAGFGDTRPYLYQGLQLASSIRLVELSPGEPEDMLCLDMYEVSLDDEPIYQALSYEWGEKMGSISVRCGDSHHLLVTPNLETALLHLRSREKTMILWIDALCINQNDMQERSKQVSMMKRIFLGASSVFLWIGRDSP
ncbi:heterokaryon incompatibility protein-domain-containing protein, partial [Cercophora newfieldiana]